MDQHEAIQKAIGHVEAKHGLTLEHDWSTEPEHEDNSEHAPSGCVSDPGGLWIVDLRGDDGTTAEVWIDHSRFGSTVRQCTVQPGEGVQP